MNLKRYAIPFAVFLIALWIGGYIWGYLGASFGSYGTGMWGWVIGGLVTFGVYVAIIRLYPKGDSER